MSAPRPAAEPSASAAPPSGTAGEAPRPLGIWGLAGPTMLSFALQTAVSFASTIIVAGLGSEADPTVGRNAVAGASIAGQVHFVAFATSCRRRS